MRLHAITGFKVNGLFLAEAHTDDTVIHTNVLICHQRLFKLITGAEKQHNNFRDPIKMFKKFLISLLFHLSKKSLYYLTEAMSRHNSHETTTRHYDIIPNFFFYRE